MKGLTLEERFMLECPKGTPVSGDYSGLVARGLVRSETDSDGSLWLRRDHARAALVLKLDALARARARA